MILSVENNSMKECPELPNYQLFHLYILENLHYSLIICKSNIEIVVNSQWELWAWMGQRQMLILTIW